MKSFEARVVKGRLVMDEPSRLPEGSIVRLLLAQDGEDSLGEEERAALHDALGRSWESAKAGRVVPAADVLARLRARR